jgi:hypothetical protein
MVLVAQCKILRSPFPSCASLANVTSDNLSLKRVPPGLNQRTPSIPPCLHSHTNPSAILIPPLPVPTPPQRHYCPPGCAPVTFAPQQCDEHSRKPLDMHLHPAPRPPPPPRSLITAPLAARQSAHLELFGRPCRCRRCSLEQELPAEAAATLQDIADKAQVGG